MKVISSRDNTFFKDLRKLHQRKYRKQQSRFMAEGSKFLDYSEYIDHIILNADYQDKYLMRLPEGITVTVLSPELFNELSAQEHSQGIIVVCKQPRPDITSLPPRIIALENIKDPGNLGTIIRTMDAAGLSHLFLSHGSVDVTNAKTIRSTMGSLFHVVYQYMPLEQMMDLFHKQGYTIIISTLDKESVDYTSIDWPEKFVLFFGNESTGVSRMLTKDANIKVHIPIYGKAESLNIAISAAILFYRMVDN